MRLKTRKHIKLTLLILILTIFTFNFFMTNIVLYQNSHITNNDYRSDNEGQDLNLKNHDLSSDNTYSGIGAAWNLTQWANRTDYDLPINFESDSFDSAEIPLGAGWEGYNLNATIKDLFDTRNWINGTFHEGADDGYAIPGDDSDDVLNWTWGKYDNPAEVNSMSGNYFNGVDDPILNEDYVELQIDKSAVGGNVWDIGDRCWWNSSFKVPRGKVVEGTIFLIIYPYTVDIYSNSFNFEIYLNDKYIYGDGLYSLNISAGGNWYDLQISLDNFLDDPDIFPDPVNNANMNITIQLKTLLDIPQSMESLMGDTQRIFFDNVSLSLKTEVKPEQIGLKMNQTDVNDIDWGKGTVEIVSKWNGTENPFVTSSFTTTEIWGLGSYDIEFTTDLNLFARKSTPETNYESNTNLIGTRFSVSNESLVDWDSYAYIGIPTGYDETLMRVEFPIDVNITWISDPQQPDLNVLDQCDVLIPGILNVPVTNISVAPDGFWKMQAISPNYCEELNIYRNSMGNWILDSEFFSGDYINITAKITDSPLISGYIQQTKAQLRIRFPNGSFWVDETQLISPDDNGYIYFNSFQIPNSPPDYEVGDYKAIITWNNSYSSYGLNETGVIYKKFTVIHDSLLTPDQKDYYDIFEGALINLKVSFNDKENGDAIENALIYTYNFTGGIQYFSEISPGFYVLLDFNCSGELSCGENNLTIFANSSLYVNNMVNVSIEIILETILTAEEFPSLLVPWNQNFTIHLNYTEKTTKNGIITHISCDWDSGYWYWFDMGSGNYIIELNTTIKQIGTYTLKINANKTGYEDQEIFVTIEIHERETGIEIYLNQIDKTLDRYIELPIGADLNITIKYIDILTDFLLKNATIQLLGEGLDLLFNENNILEQYSIIINTDELDIGVKFLTIYAQKSNYQPYSVVLRIVVRRINTEIIISSGESTINIKPGESVSIKLVLNDLDFNQTITNASVTYTWTLGQGALLDSNNDGIYETTLANVQEGTYTITISVYAGDNYEFERYRITLNVIRTPEESLLFIILTIVSITAALGIGGYFIAYQRVLKYPKPVRKIRKYKSSLKKKDAPNVEIHSRTELLKMHYQEELESNVKTIIEKRKSKLQGQKSSLDKLMKAEDDDLSKD